MSLVKRQLKIQRTLDFLEREEEAKERRRRRRAEREEANRHKKNVLVVDSGRPVYFWHWKVHKNTCRHGYLFINTLYRINVSHLSLTAHAVTVLPSYLVIHRSDLLVGF